MSLLEKKNSRHWTLIIAALLFAGISLGACDITAALPIPAATPTPCTGNCPPPVRAGSERLHTVETMHFTLIYFDPWQVQKSDQAGVTLLASTQFGDITTIVTSADVPAGTTGPGLLTQTEQQVLDPSLYTNIQDIGVIRGAEIGYVDGAGESYEAESLQPNAPDVPVYFQLMASVHGTVGLTFVAISPLNPNSPVAGFVPNAEYDHIVNSIQWL
jgi:hypothetical protein